MYGIRIFGGVRFRYGIRKNCGIRNVHDLIGDMEHLLRGGRGEGAAAACLLRCLRREGAAVGYFLRVLRGEGAAAVFPLRFLRFLRFLRGGCAVVAEVVEHFLDTDHAHIDVEVVPELIEDDACGSCVGRHPEGGRRLRGRAAGIFFFDRFIFIRSESGGEGRRRSACGRCSLSAGAVQPSFHTVIKPIRFRITGPSVYAVGKRSMQTIGLGNAVAEVCKLYFQFGDAVGQSI